MIRKRCWEKCDAYHSFSCQENECPYGFAGDSGNAYQYMAPAVFETNQFAYVQEHLRILSAFYGVLKPVDGVTPYRLEMQAKASVAGDGNPYDFWGRKLYEAVRDKTGIIII
jgi:hypothetical protein